MTFPDRSILLASYAPTADPAWFGASTALRLRFWRAVGEIGHRVKLGELARGIDRHGKPLKPVQPRKDGAKGPPLSPHDLASRTQDLLRWAADGTHAVLYWPEAWITILGYHADGLVRGAPVRDVLGISPAGRKRIAALAASWWKRRAEHAVLESLAVGDFTIAPTGALKGQAPAAQPAVALDLGQFTLHTGIADTLKAAAAAGHFTGFHAKVKGVSATPPPPPPPPAPKPAPKPKPKPAPKPAKVKPPKPPTKAALAIARAKTTLAVKPVPPPPVTRPASALVPTPAAAPPRPIGYQGADPPAEAREHTRRLDADNQAMLARLGARHGLGADAYAEQAAAVLGEAVAQGSFFVRVRDEVLRQILADGRFKSQFETNSSGGILSPRMRENVEVAVLGVPRATAPAERPIYGYVSHRDTAHPQAEGGTVAYGKVAIKLKDHVRARATVTFGDSLGQEDALQASPAAAVAARSFPFTYEHLDPVAVAQTDPGRGVLDWAARNWGYVEAQHPGLSVSDIDMVEFPYQPGAESIAALQSHGIRWEVRP